MPYSGRPHAYTTMHDTLANDLIDAGRLFHQRGWVPATGGNFSVRIDAQSMLITASGTHKGELDAGKLLVADFDGHAQGAGKPSYETLLHCQLYRMDPAIGGVLHTHSVANTVLSRRHAAVELSGYELLKLLPGIQTHDATVRIPVFDNDQDIARLAARIDTSLRAAPDVGAYLIAGHGLYAWGASVTQARHRVEALEFMFECALAEAR